MMTLNSKVQHGRAGRLDCYLVEEYPQFSRSFLKNMIEQGKIWLNGKNVKAGARIKPGDEIVLEILEAQAVAIKAEDIPVEIVYQDEDIAVIDKAQGMVTHPAPGNYEGTLVNAIMYHIGDLSGINGELRPGIVHRLDKDTSGLLVIAKNDQAHQNLSRQIAEKDAKRFYLALVFGTIKSDSGIITTQIGRDPRDRKKMAVVRQGREAVTLYRVIQRYEGYTLVECELKTGRTHQIRVHLKHIGFPIVGDAVYTKQKDKFALKGQLLHACRLELAHPRTGEQMKFCAPLPNYYQKVLDLLKKV